METSAILTKICLQTEVDPLAGFCFGVVAAIRTAEEILDKEGKLYCLGEIVHNEEESLRLEKKGLTKISHHQLPGIHNSKILIRAHGEPPETYIAAGKNNNSVIDATCTTILDLQRQIRKSYERGEQIFIFGKTHHPEVIGLNGQTNNTCTVFNSPEQLKTMNLPESIFLYSQTTMDKEAYHRVYEYFADKGIRVEFHQSICNQVSGRKQELDAFCRRFDKIVFVAGKNSSNGKVLYRQCRAINPKTCFVSNVEELQKDWFAHGELVGITGATSTPCWLLRKIADTLNEW